MATRYPQTILASCEIPWDEQSVLPAGRVEQLKSLRLVEEQTDEQAMDKRLRSLEARIAKLERKRTKAAV